MKKEWKTKPFEDCIEQVKYTRKIQRKDFLDDGQFPIVSQEAEFTNGYWDDETDVFRVSTPVVIFGDHTQVFKYVDFDFVLGADGVKVLQPRDFLRPKFFFYELQAANFTSLGYARHYRLLKELVIKYPPLSEQQRIVGILDEAFEGISRATATAKKNLHNTRSLFESHLQSVFTQRGKGWVENTLGDVCEFIGGSQPPKSVFSKHKTPDSIRLIQIRDYKSDKHVVYIPRAQARRFCSIDDVMIGRYGPPLFQILRGLDGAYNVALMKAVPDESKLTRDFLFYFLKHSEILEYVIYHSSRAAGQIGLTKETLEPYPIALPSLVEQKKVVGVITDLATETQRLEAIYQQKLAALNELKKSLLNCAFNGELTGDNGQLTKDNGQ
jgi:type I restriction enzyme S subunit